MSVNITLETILNTLVHYPYPIETKVADMPDLPNFNGKNDNVLRLLITKTIDIREYAWKALKIYENDMFNLQEENQQLRKEVEILKNCIGG